jgi:acyl dehydratase
MAMTERRQPGVAVGDSREAVVVDHLTRTQIVQYAGASGDYNPLHTDEPFATEVAGFPSVFGHGMLTMGATAKVLTDWFGDASLRRYGVRFLTQVWPGDRLVARATVVDVRTEEGAAVADIEVTTVNQHGEVLLAGYAVAVLP